MASKFLKNPNGGVYKDSNGKLVKVDLSLPTLSNPATAEDIASGKEAINADGVVVTGTMESGDEATVISGRVTPNAITTSITIDGIEKKPKAVSVYTSWTPTNYAIKYIAPNPLAEVGYEATVYRNSEYETNIATSGHYVKWEYSNNQVIITAYGGIYKFGKYGYDYQIVY